MSPHSLLCQPLAMAQMETQRENKGEPPIKKYQIETFLTWKSSDHLHQFVKDCETLQRPQKAQNTHTLWKIVDFWELHQENITVKYKIFSKSCHAITCI